MVSYNAPCATGGTGRSKRKPMPCCLPSPWVMVLLPGLLGFGAFIGALGELAVSGCLLTDAPLMQSPLPAVAFRLACHQRKEFQERSGFSNAGGSMAAQSMAMTWRIVNTSM